ncbi:MAG: cell division protein FtsZ [Dysgonamonadaceae bacterium]|jgi:cell division protein FtsZ|nr:cell division protein FtsZ [Dysgonamonadaceae bacterium]
MDDSLIKFELDIERPSIIKVIGVGGGGGNAVNHMYREGIHDVSFVLCNTDSQALFKSDVPTRLQLGKTVTEGLGAGNRPEKARLAAEESSDDIWKLMDDGTKMVFITAGMGGGTGTGAAPVIARIAKSMEILTVGIVTIPFVFEGKRKIIQALDGVEKIAENVDALLVINNERLRDIYHDLDVPNAFQKADDTLTIAAKSIAEIITVPGYINLDFADVHTILKDGGVAIMSSGLGAGESRVSKAIEDALNSPLLNNNDVFNAKKILLNISSSHEFPLMMEEMSEVHDFMSRFDSDIEVIWGTAIDNGLLENIKITILATGFEMSHVPLMKDRIEKGELAKRRDEVVRLEEEERRRKEDEIRIRKFYGEPAADKLNKGSRPKPFIFPPGQLDDDSLIDIIVKYPAYNRDLKKMMREIEQLGDKYKYADLGEDDEVLPDENPEPADSKDDENIIEF